MVDSINEGGPRNNILRGLSEATQERRRSLARLSSGEENTTPGTNPAAQEIIDELERASATTRVAIRNTSDAVSQTNIASSALSQVNQTSNRLDELATQSSNGLLNDSQRATLNQEFQSLTEEISRIAETTTFNDRQLLRGESLSAQVGTDGSENSIISTRGVDVGSLVGDLQSADISTVEGARDALETIDSFRNEISAALSDIGEVQGRLEVSLQQNSTSLVTAEEAASLIRDADVAQETARNTAADIRQQANVALLGQASRQDAGRVQTLLSS